MKANQHWGPVVVIKTDLVSQSIGGSPSALSMMRYLTMLSMLWPKTSMLLENAIPSPSVGTRV